MQFLGLDLDSLKLGLPKPVTNRDHKGKKKKEKKKKKKKSFTSHRTMAVTLVAQHFLQLNRQ